MSREIRFRGWDVNGHMFYPDPQGDFQGLTSGKILDRFDTVMQYTGLKDKNGTEIYEGDIVEMRHKTKSIILEIVYDFLGGVYKGHDGLEIDFQTAFEQAKESGITSMSEIIEVVGNIHENPELIK